SSIDKCRQGIWLTSFSGLPVTKGYNIKSVFKKGKKSFPENFFDWIIVDEAHSLKGGSQDMDENSKLEGSAVRKIYAVINAKPKAKVLLLTATPFQNNANELKHLLSMLEQIEKRDDQSTISGLISCGIKALEKEFEKLTKGEITIDNIKQLKHKFDNDLNSLIGCDKNKGVHRPRALQIRGAKNGLDDYLRDVMIRNKKELLPIIPVVATLSEKDKFQYLLYRDLIKKGEEESQMFSIKLSQLVSSEESFSKNNINSIQNKNIKNLFKGNLIFESKYKKLLETIENITLTGNKKVITIFVSWIETVNILEKRLKKNKYKIFQLTGEIHTDERKNVLKRIKEANDISNEKIILIASRVGNEGLDFDGFSNRVIHYDNNFNPAIIDQRNGRVYRGSNIKTSKKNVTADDIKIYQLFIEESYDQRILFIEQEKRKMKNFYLGDCSLQKVLEKTIEKNNLKQEKEILKILDSIKIDLTPSKKYIFKKYRNEIDH
ncbi:MAG: DEAD/DEAH box helicase, partial [Bacteroidota bacterium]|nr:DEAD/DEAH box helicase [Bacteroidota bacterium]